MSDSVKLIALDEISNLSQLFRLRVTRTPDSIAYCYFDKTSQSWQKLSWSEMAERVARWQAALKQENLNPGDRVAIMLNNSPEWVMYEQAAIGLGLIVVPLYTNDRPENVGYIINDAQARVLLLETAEQWQCLKQQCRELECLVRVVCMESVADADEPRLSTIENWLPDASQRYILHETSVHKSTLVTIVYTSGTTGKPKGVMLSHQNIFWNAHAGLGNVDVYSQDSFLSFLPISHMFERTIGYYLPMICGCTVTYARSIDKLAEDLVTHKPSIIITVPRIFERVNNRLKTQLEQKSPFARYLFERTVQIGWARFLYQQGKKTWRPALLWWPVLYFLVGRKVMAKLGGRLRLAVSGGAPLSLDVARMFIGLGLTISQGYGLTEASPVISTNKLDDNDPESVGQALPGIEIKLGEHDELMVRCPSVMLGYWNQESATREMIDADGWLHTGDKVRIDNKHIYITGRLKEILVLSNGEKIPPADVEMAICTDPLFDQALVVGEQKPFLTALVVLNAEHWQTVADTIGLSPEADKLTDPLVQKHVIKHIQQAMAGFPGYAKIFHVTVLLEPWTVENGLLTPTLKLKRSEIMAKYTDQITLMYQGH